MSLKTVSDVPRSKDVLAPHSIAIAKSSAQTKPSKDPFKSLVHAASQAQLQELVMSLAHRDPSMQLRAKGILTEEFEDAADDAADDANLEEKTCAGCGKRYRVRDNCVGACEHFVWHPGT